MFETNQLRFDVQNIVVQFAVNCNRPYLTWILPLFQNEFSCKDFTGSFSCKINQRFCTKTRFEAEAQGTLENGLFIAFIYFEDSIVLWLIRRESVLKSGSPRIKSSSDLLWSCFPGCNYQIANKVTCCLLPVGIVNLLCSVCCICDDWWIKHKCP